MSIHHDGSAPYVSNPAPALGEIVTVFVRVAAHARVDRMHLRRLRNGEPEFAPAVVDRREPGAVWWRADLPVHNTTNPYRFLLRTPQGLRWLTRLGLTDHDVPDAADFRMAAAAEPLRRRGTAVHRS